ncbi:MAG TPA: carboxypeptidase regulatory-like domain-containing protein [Candidatus Acidoferrales bacterium]|nr:carboxypeptidase regulatory-like domain-containing protein [Candidatus Acidoferrales bacterium]
MKRFVRLASFVVCCLCVLAFYGAAATSAQTFRGTILGTVTDSSGLAVASATVTIKNTGTGLTRTVATSEDGAFSVPELPIGTYTVTVEMAGFRKASLSGIVLEVSADRRVDISLTPGDVAQTVEVLGDTLPQVESTNNTLGGIVESKVVTSLPVNGRDYQKLIFLVPGVAGSPDQITDSPGSFGIFSVNGARGRANNFLLDGTDMNDGYRNDPAINEAGVFGTPATILPIEAIAELRVASNFEAEYGRSAGGVINVVTKSGSNEWHGSGFEFLRNTKLNARNYFNDVSQEKQPFHNNQFGGSLGGPIVHDKTFFFLDYEAMRESGKESSPACVPTAADIASATPAGGINPVIAALLARNPWPAPTNNNDCLDGEDNNAELATPFTNRVDSAIVKIDHNLSKDKLLTGRYYIGDSTQSFPLALTGGGLLPDFNTHTPTRVQLVSISYVDVISPGLVSETRLGWNRFAEGFFPEDRTFDPTSIGLNTINSVPAFLGTTNDTPYNFGLPFISVSGLASLGSDKGDPRQRVDSNWHYIDNFSWTKGRHQFKFGYEFRRTSVSQIFNRGFRGTLSFDTLGDFLAGVPDRGSIRAGNTDRNTFEVSHAGYIQDTYRLRRTLTLSLGLRYDYFGIMQEKHGNFSNIDPSTGDGFFVGGGRLYQPDYNNWAPRASIAWDATGKGKTVLRAGYGFFYDAFSQDMFMGHLPFNSGFDPGPAYSGFFFDPNPISSGSLRQVFDPVTDTFVNAPLDSTQPVYEFFSNMGDAFGVDQRIRTPYMENYNVNLQQQIGSRMVVQLGYVGSQGHKLFRFRDLNQPTLATIQNFNYNAASIAANNGVNVGDIAGCFCTTPFALNNGLEYINYEESSANSNYNSLQASWRINGWRGLTSTLNYTWSHSLDDASDGEDYVPNAAQPDNSQGPIGLNRGNSNFDVRNRIAWNFIYEFPSTSGNWQKLRNGWGLNGILTIQSGQPFQLNYNFEDDYNGTGEGFARPDVVRPVVYHRGDPRNFLDLTSFAVPCTLGGGTGAGNCQLIDPATGAVCTSQGIGPNCINSMHFGNEGRNSLIGPKFRQFDFSIFKNTQLTEKLKLEIRFEAYNLLNHPNFANPYLPSFIADAAPNGVDTTGRSVGSLGLGATGDVGIGYPFLGSGGPRSMQVAAKFTF